MKTNIFLATGGAIMGLVLVGALYLIRPEIFFQLGVGRGSSFGSLADLRAAMQNRTDDDNQSDREVPLRGIVLPHPSDSIIYQLQPNRTAQFRHKQVTMNSFGMRSPEITVAKPANTKRVVVLGDSYAFGWGVEENQVFSRWMEKELRASAPAGQSVEVLNFGVPGYATFQEVAAFFDKGVQFDPDFVLVYFINNDFGLPFFIRDLTNQVSLLPAPEFERQKELAKDPESQAKRQALLRALDSNRALLELGTYCKERNIPLLVVPHPDHTVPKSRKRLWVLKRSPGRELVPFKEIEQDYQKMIESQHIPKESLSIPRDHHPGPGAHEAVGRVLAELIRPILWVGSPAHGN